MIFILEKVDQTGLQTGFIVDYTDWLQMRIGFEVRSRHWHWLQPLIENKTRLVVTSGWFQEQSMTKELGWSAEQHKLGWQPMHVDFKTPRSDYKNLYIFIVYDCIDSCVMPNKKVLIALT